MGTYIIFGAAVKQGGIPSGALRRRIHGALNSAKNDNHAVFIATGGLGKYPPTEAEVMQNQLVAHGIDQSCIFADNQSQDTLQSIVESYKIITKNQLSDIVICTDLYHMLRCKLLFKVLDVSSSFGDVPSGRSAMRTRTWLYHIVREVIAIPYDLVLLTATKARLLRKF